MITYLKERNMLSTVIEIVICFSGTNFGTKADRILVVGAHWDTVSNSPGMKDVFQTILILM